MGWQIKCRNQGTKQRKWDLNTRIMTAFFRKTCKIQFKANDFEQKDSRRILRNEYGDRKLTKRGCHKGKVYRKVSLFEAGIILYRIEIKSNGVQNRILRNLEKALRSGGIGK